MIFRFFHRLLMPLLAIFLISGTVDAQAQFLPGISGSEAKSDASALKSLIDEAQQNGSTVIVVSPQKQAQAEDDSTMANMRAERFLEARSNIRQIVGSWETLAQNAMNTLRAASPDGTFFWLWRGIGTALLGIVIAFFATRPIITWFIKNVSPEEQKAPETSADKIGYLLYRAFFALVLMVIYFIIALIIAIVLDSGYEPTRRVIFEMVAWYCTYRFLRHGVSWNIFAGAMPQYRMVNLSDEEAVTLHRDWHIGVAIAATFAAVARTLSFTGQDQIAAGLTNVLTIENIKLIQMCTAVLIILILFVYIIKDWKTWQHIFAPADSSAPFYRLRSRVASVVPVFALGYSVAAMGTFLFRLALDMPAPGIVIAAPFAIFYVAIVVYGLALIGIQAFYNRREKRFHELAEQERARRAAEDNLLDVEAGEEMQRGPSSTDPVQFEYQPSFRAFFENAALAIVVIVSADESARIWGVPIGDDGNAWAAALDVLLTAVLCWIAYNAVKIFIDRRIAEEGGAPESEDDEMGGEGGGAGATRMATLLPIFRYVLFSIIFFVAIMVVLSRMGIDIAPIFAGAGVVGIAVGFGAQTLIRDIFSGAFFLMDDAFRKGEYVEIEGIKGTVEKISIRSFQLRHHLGALHTIPFGEIKQLTNYSRDWVMMKLPLRVTYDTDVEKVRKLVKKLGQRLLEHPQVGHTFMQPLKSQGVYKMEDSAMIIRVKFMTKPGEQFVTRKVVYESIQDLFAQEGIHFAHKEVTVRLADGQKTDDLSEQERQAVSSAARSIIDAEQEALATAGGGKNGGDR